LASEIVDRRGGLWSGMFRTHGRDPIQIRVGLVHSGFPVEISELAAKQVHSMERRLLVFEGRVDQHGLDRLPSAADAHARRAALRDARQEVQIAHP